MTRLPTHHPLSEVLRPYLGEPHQTEGFVMEPLRASRPVFRFSASGDGFGLVGKFYVDQVPITPRDRSLAQEYLNYQAAPAWGLGAGVIPRLVGHAPGVRLGLLLEAVPAPDLDHFLAAAAHGVELETCFSKIAKLAELLVIFHTHLTPRQPVSPEPALAYFHKLHGQLRALELISPEEESLLAEEGRAWEARFAAFPDHQVLLHGDATPTNFLFPDGRALAVDLERLRAGDRLFDLSWVTGELRHAWGWRGRDFTESEAAIQTFFRAYLEALPAASTLAPRIFTLNPFYMALAELRIARNTYLSWEYRRALVEEAWRCLTYGRRMT